MDLVTALFFIAVIIFSAILHEYSHGWVADQMGDPTARYAGRLTLNPASHIDPIGSIVLPIGLFLISGGSFLFAYAKPVPYNPYNLKDQKRGPGLVAAAGPIANFALALVFGLLLQFLPISLTLKILFAIVVYANVLLGVFNLVPIPPLDGSKVLFSVLPDRYYKVRVMLERYGFVLLIFFLFFLFELIQPSIFWAYRLFTGGFGLF